MFFKKNHEDIIQRILSSTDGTKVQMHHLSSDVADLVKVIRRLEIVVEQMTNDFSVLQCRVMSMQNQLTSSLEKLSFSSPLQTTIKTNMKTDNKNRKNIKS